MSIVRRRGSRFDELVTSCGQRVTLHGEPMIENDGQLHVGDDVVIASQPAMTHLATGKGGLLRVGNGVRIGHGAAISSLDRVEIGDGAALGPFVMIMDSDFHVAGDRAADAPPEPVTIGRHAVIGHWAVILPGSRIGDRVVVAPGSVVSGTIADDENVSGNPAVPRSATRFDGDELEATVPGVVANVFEMSAPPSPDDGPDTITGWDSLGALRLLLSLESTFHITLDEHDLATNQTVGELECIVTELVQRRLAGRERSD
jgi:acetyltransferase-like isoleucine patch superfamily enzyme/acyl carrier protein